MLRDLEGYAASARLMTSPLQLGDWLERTFGEEIVAKRRARERAATALEKGAPVVVQPVVASAPVEEHPVRPERVVSTPPPGDAAFAAALAPPAPVAPAAPVPTVSSAARPSPRRAVAIVGAVAIAAAVAGIAAHVMHLW
jgi:hypothetical protein